MREIKFRAWDEKMTFWKRLDELIFGERKEHTYEEAERFWHYGDSSDEKIAEYKNEVKKHMEDIKKFINGE